MNFKLLIFAIEESDQRIQQLYNKCTYEIFNNETIVIWREGLKLICTAKFSDFRYYN